MSENHYTRPNQPDVLEVIANLSSNEVFTPPRVVNAVLDLLPPHVWTDPSLRWLDPGSKTGVFPREITKRLMLGLAEAIPDEQARLHHILNEMVFAFAITDMTAMMTRRSLYCSKDASSALAASPLATPEGNVWHQRIEHSYDAKGRCTECGGTKTQLEQPGRDNYAYGFIHKEGRQQITKETNMKFDVIVGNPPYQMQMGESSDVPLYNVFVEEAKKLSPQYIAMIIPSRWMAGGKWLDDFRATMLGDKRVRKIVDYSLMQSVFPGSVDFEGGVCYFMWDRDNPGTCEFTHVQGETALPPEDRHLDEFDVLVRDSRALSILRKVRARNEKSLVDLVTGQTPFGLLTNFKGYRRTGRQEKDLKLIVTEGGARTEKWVSPDEVTRGHDLLKGWKVFVPEAYGERGAIPARVLGPTVVASPKTVCTQTFLAVGTVPSKNAAESLDAYLQTRLVRFLVSLRKITQHAGRGTYSWVPQQTWDRTWTDAELYKKYGITKEEQEYIESMVKEWPA
jgi:site-specific DNA-methyltransferase (adenine-specific)